MQSGTLLRDLVNLVDQIHFDSSDDIHTMAFVYESILKEMRDAAGDSGEFFYTPRPVNRFMVQQSFLKHGETILDPACGTGGFLVQAYEELRAVDTDSQRQRLHASIKGIEKKKPLPYLLASMNLLLHGISAPQLVRDNALLRMRDATAADRVDVVLTNPPFGGEEERSVVEKFPKGYQTQETSWLFLHAILDQLKQGGRCAIVLPNGSLFASGENSIGARIKQKLMRECNLHTIVRLPQGAFAPYTQIPSNLLFFDKGIPTQEVWFYEIPLPEGRRGYTKTKPMRVEEFEPVCSGGAERSAKAAKKAPTPGRSLPPISRRPATTSISPTRTSARTWTTGHPRNSWTNYLKKRSARSSACWKNYVKGWESWHEAHRVPCRRDHDACS